MDTALEARQRAHVLYTWSAQSRATPLPIAGARGAVFTDHEGQRWLDFESQVFKCNAGHGEARIIRAMQAQLEQLACAHPAAVFEAKAALGERLAEITPARDVHGNESTAVTDGTLLDVTPPANPKPTAVTSGGVVTVSWAAPVDAHSGLASMTLRYAAGAASKSCSEGKVLVTGSHPSFVHSGLSAGAVAGYRVCATDVVGNVTAGGVVKVTVKP